jgi:hypothetical protein
MLNLPTFENISWKSWAAGWALIFGGCILPFAVMLGVTEPEKFELSLVTGCYIHSHGPAIKLQGGRLEIEQQGKPVLSYRVEPWKPGGWTLVVEPAYGPEMISDNTYRFELRRGQGYFWPLLRTDRNKTRLLGHPSQFQGMFSIIADDGTELIYTRTKDARMCDAA